MALMDALMDTSGTQGPGDQESVGLREPQNLKPKNTRLDHQLFGNLRTRLSLALYTCHVPDCVLLWGFSLCANYDPIQMKSKNRQNASQKDPLEPLAGHI
uniref:Uncharacterized protein n=1 Tax=Chlorocebus sabaeus TaxID=60711 RepID=A0A0D9RUR5_CHLSB